VNTLGEVRLDGEAATVALAERLAPALRGGDVLALVGEMGAGKSTFCRALGRALGVPAETPMPSPSFSLVLEYPLPAGRQPAGPDRLVHADIYRLGDADELIPLGGELSPSDPAISQEAVTVVEWADRLPAAFGPATLWLTWFDAQAPTGEQARRVVFSARGADAAAFWSARLQPIGLP
jgi:tRNA threonylcarbamoyladenosine biosynthesis protein TsaE